MNRLEKQVVRPSSVDRHDARVIRLNHARKSPTGYGIGQWLSMIGQNIVTLLRKGLVMAGVIEEYSITEPFPKFLVSGESRLRKPGDFTRELTPMPTRARARIIVEKSDDHWTAWFAEIPQRATRGAFPGDALWQLLQLFEHELNCNLDAIAAIDSATTDDHLEFSVPYWRLKRIPKPSSN